MGIVVQLPVHSTRKQYPPVETLMPCRAFWMMGAFLWWPVALGVELWLNLLDTRTSASIGMKTRIPSRSNVVPIAAAKLRRVS